MFSYIIFARHVQTKSPHFLLYCRSLHLHRTRADSITVRQHKSMQKNSEKFNKCLFVTHERCVHYAHREQMLFGSGATVEWQALEAMSISTYL